MNLWRSSILMVLLVAAESAKILIAIPFPGKSHYISNKNIGIELAKRGHEVYVITSNTETETISNYNEVVVNCKAGWNIMDVPFPSIEKRESSSFVRFINFLHESGKRHSECCFNSTEVQTLLKQNHQFDLVISEVFFRDSFYMFSHYYNAPLVLLTTFGNSFRTNYFIKNPTQLSTVLHEYLKEKDPGSFWGRVNNLWHCIYETALYELIYASKQENVAKMYLKNLREPVPSIKDITANASLVLMNSHFSFDGPVAYLPNVVEIGGLHLQNNNGKLPVDLQNFMDSSTDGVVILSFGSNLCIKELSEEKRQVFLKVLGKLKQKVLFKWEVEQPKEKPDNVEMRKWLPQKELFAHGNVKLFISHGGLIGLQEATYYGVPVLGIPIYGDQLNNVLQAQKLGFAELIEFKDLNEINLEKVINNILRNDKYYKIAKEISQRFIDRPMSPLDTAMYWIEYVIRYKGTKFLKQQRMEINLLSYYLLDIFIVLIITLVLVVFSLKIVSKFIKSLFRNLASHRKK